MSVENDENRISINPFMCGDSHQKKGKRDREHGSNSSNLSESDISLVYSHVVFGIFEFGFQECADSMFQN